MLKEFSVRVFWQTVQEIVIVIAFLLTAQLIFFLFANFSTINVHVVFPYKFIDESASAFRFQKVFFEMENKWRLFNTFERDSN